MTQNAQLSYILFSSTKRSKSTSSQVSLTRLICFAHRPWQCHQKSVCFGWASLRHRLTFLFYLLPGVHRETDEDREFANFSIFDDPDKPYSTFKFQYDGRTFDRLHELMKFNTLLNVDLIKEKMAQQVQYRRNNPQMLLRWITWSSYVRQIFK